MKILIDKDFIDQADCYTVNLFDDEIPLWIVMSLDKLMQSEFLGSKLCLCAPLPSCCLRREK